MAEIPPQPTGHEPTRPRYNRRLGYVEQVEVQPTHCHRAHPYRIGTQQARVSISWVGCSCADARSGGHNLYFCRTIVDGQECGDVRWQPECEDPSQRAKVGPTP
jgi:hypothetical protein